MLKRVLSFKVLSRPCLLLYIFCVWDSSFFAIYGDSRETQRCSDRWFTEDLSCHSETAGVLQSLSITGTLLSGFRLCNGSWAVDGSVQSASCEGLQWFCIGGSVCDWHVVDPTTYLHTDSAGSLLLYAAVKQWSCGTLPDNPYHSYTLGV